MKPAAGQYAQFKDAALAALGDKILFKFAPCPQIFIAGTAADLGTGSHILRERKVDGVALGTSKLAVQALEGRTAHGRLAVSRNKPICAINFS
jgi:hypothetical protein